MFLKVAILSFSPVASQAERDGFGVRGSEVGQPVG